MTFTYKPLPDNVHLLPSEIEGLGIHAKDFIPADSLIGISHVEDDSGKFHNNLIRSALGAFLNHSDAPNCMLITTEREWYLWTTEDVYPNYECTIDYNLYRCYV